jgi:hypothetical protein
MAMSFETRVGLLKLGKLARVAVDTAAEPQDDTIEAALTWIDQQLARDEQVASKEQRAKEWGAAGLCTRCGDDDPQCICYTR